MGILDRLSHSTLVNAEIGQLFVSNFGEPAADELDQKLPRSAGLGDL